MKNENYNLLANKKYDMYWKKIDTTNGKYLSSEFKDLFYKMISYNPNSRPTC